LAVRSPNLKTKLLFKRTKKVRRVILTLTTLVAAAITSTTAGVDQENIWFQQGGEEASG